MKRVVLLAFAAGLMTSSAALADQGARSSDRNEVEARLRDKAEGKYHYKDQRFDSIKGQPFQAPPGWQPRYYGVGDFVPAVFMKDPYIVDGPSIHLPPAKDGRHWVRIASEVYEVAGRGKVLDVVGNVYID